MRELKGVDRLTAKANREQDDEAREQAAEISREAERMAKEEEDQRAADAVDLLKIIRSPDGDTNFPIKVTYWNILVEMLRPKDRMGRFIKVQSQIDNEQYLTTVGRVLKCGPAAFDGKTTGGIELNRMCEGVCKPEDLVGNYVIMQRYTGTDLFFAPLPAKKLRYISNTEVLSVTTNPYLWMRS